jgi:glycosyltransferase involved in cell wall biosynthesis
MRIALNLLFVAPGVAGGRVYAEGLLRGLAAVDRENEYVVFTRRGILLPDLPPERFRQVQAPVWRTSSLWRTFWEYAVLPGRVRRGRFDLLHGLGSLSPRTAACPLVLTIHDLIYHHFPESLPAGYRLFMEAGLPRMARRAERIITPSRHTAREVVEHFGVPLERVRVIAEGPGSPLRPQTDEACLRATRERYDIDRPYMISVCRGYRHKNLAGLLRAFALLRDGGVRHQLVLVGEEFRGGRELDRLARELGLSADLVFTGFVSEAELATLYSGADVFAFPSLAEGFGLPVLEAMACGTPVVASKAAAIPEVVGEAGVLADASDPRAFANALATVLKDEDLRVALRKRGLDRARQFSWEQCAQETLAVYREVGGGRP